MAVFVVIEEQGPSWVDGRSMRGQELWNAHADFVNGLMSDGFAVLGGPIGSGKPHRALLVVSAESESAARERLETDPWIRDGILRIGSVQRWTILVGDDKLASFFAERTTPATTEQPRR